LIYEFENFRLDADRRELRRGAELVTLEPQVFDVLECLIRNRERIVTKDDLIADVWDGRIVADSTLSSRITAVRHAIGDSGDQQRFIRTISRRGFRFVGTIRVDPAGLPEGAQPAMRPATSATGRPESGSLILPDKPSIAVLPFANFSGDPEQAYFADGMVDEIISALSQIPSLFVIARTSTFAYRDKAIDIRQVGRELGVRYILEGSVRRDGDRVRIMPQLIDALTGTHLWTERFEGSPERIFDLQDRLTESVVGAIAPNVQRAEIERARRKPTESLDAYDYFLRGVATFNLLTKESNVQAVPLFERAIELDPQYASACGMAAWCYVRRKAWRWMVDPPREITEALRLARKAVDLGPDDALALSTGGFALAYIGNDLEDGVTFIDRAIAISPNLASALVFSGWMRIYLGEHDTAIEHFLRSIRLSPLDPFIFSSQHAGIAFAHMLMGRHEEAASWARLAMRGQPKSFFTNVVSASTEGLCGRLGDARTAMERVRQLDPTLRIANLHGLEPLRRSGDLALWAEGMRQAGMPE
jgi:TolB-like protein